jgi:hypothetical protein
MRCIAVALAAAIAIQSPVRAASQPQKQTSSVSTEAVLKWVGDYRFKPEPMRVPIVMRALSQGGVLKDPEAAAVYLGFFAGVLNGTPDLAEDVIGKTLPLPFEDQWIVIRGIAYSGHSNWKDLLRKFAMHMPGRQTMIHKFLEDKLPTLDQIAFDHDLTWQEKVKVYFTGKGADEGKLKLEPTPEIVDVLWGFYFATGSYRPVAQIVAMLRWTKDDNSVEKLTVGSMAKYTLATNAARDAELLQMLRWQLRQMKEEDKPVLAEVIDAAETVDTVKLRKMALASIEDLKSKGPGYKRNIATWGQVGQAAIGLGCIAAAAVGTIALGLPCVIGGAVSTAAINAWAKQ